MESSRNNKYQYGVGLMAVTNLASGNLGSVNFDSVLEQRAKERFPSSKILLAFVHDRRRLSCIRKLATLGQPGTERALWPIRMTVVTAPW